MGRPHPRIAATCKPQRTNRFGWRVSTDTDRTDGFSAHRGSSFPRRTRDRMLRRSVTGPGCPVRTERFRGPVRRSRGEKHTLSVGDAPQNVKGESRPGLSFGPVSVHFSYPSYSCPHPLADSFRQQKPFWHRPPRVSFYSVSACLLLRLRHHRMTRPVRPRSRPLPFLSPGPT